MPFEPEKFGTERYAVDENNAESGDNYMLPSSVPSENLGMDGREFDDAEGDKPRPEAKIWSFYLTKAEERARQQAELWKTGLESLLIFAGLFAGVVASFVVESRRDLRPQTKADILLVSILNTLRDENDAQDMFEPTTSNRWINGLWFVSLLVTLFSAIMGVLAKSWIVKFIPVASGQDSDDAYRRWVHDERAKLWYLEKGITTIPLLLQLALLLFCLGFALQTIGDDPSLGWVVLTLVVLGVVIYAIITALPLWYPWIPIQTPLSDILVGIIRLYRSVPPSGSTTLAFKRVFKNRSRQEVPDKNHVLLEIWHSQLTHPARPAIVDEAIAELSRMKLSSEWWKYFVEWDGPNILCNRLRESVTYGLRHNFAYDVLCYHLYALSGLTEHFENSEPGKLSTQLGYFLEARNPLNRWNVFPETIRALAFSVRTPILLACKKDYTAREMEDRPWETMVHDMPQNHRLQFAMAACRGLAGDQKRLRKMSTLSIIVCIAKATTVAIGPKSEWVVEVSAEARKKTEFLGRRYLQKLFEEIAIGWKEVILENSTKVVSTAINSDFLDMIIPGSPRSGPKNLSTEFRRQIAMFGMLANDRDFEQIVKSSIPRLAKISVDTPDEDIRNHAFTGLISLTYNAECQDIIKQTLLETLGSALQSLYSRTRVRGIGLLVSLVQSSVFQDHFQGIVASLVYRFFGSLITNYNEAVRKSAMRSLRSLCLNEYLQNIIKVVAPASFNSLFHSSHAQLRLHALETLQTFVKKPQFPDIIRPIVPKVIDLITNDEDSNVRIVGIKTIRVIIQDGALRGNALPTFPKVLDISWDKLDSPARIPWIEILVALAQNADHREFIKVGIPTLLDITLNDGSESVRDTGMKAIASFTHDDFLFDAITPEFLQRLHSTMENGGIRKVCATNVLITLAKDPNLWGLIKEAIPGFIEIMINDPDDEVRTSGTKSLAPLIQEDDTLKQSLSKRFEINFHEDSKKRVRFIDIVGEIPEFRNITQSAIPGVVNTAVNDTNVEARIAGIKMIARLVNDDNLQNDIIPTASNILNSAWQDPHWQVRAAWAAMVVDLSYDPNFQQSIESAMSILIRIARRDSNRNVRVAGIKAVASLAQNEKFRDIIKEDLIKMLQTTPKDRAWELRVAWADIHVPLVHNAEFRGCIESDVPKLLEFAIHDADKDTRIASLKSLVSLMEDDKPWTTQRVARDAIKLALTKNSELPSKDSNWQVRIVWVKALEAILNQNYNLRDNFRSATAKLVEIAVDDTGPDVRENALNALTLLLKNNDGIREAIILALPKNIDVVFRDIRLRADWSRILYTIAQSAPRRLGGVARLAIPRIAKMAVVDDDHDVRNINVEILNFLVGEPNFRETSKSALSKILDSALKDFDWELRIRAIDLLDQLFQRVNFRDVVKSAIPQLLKMAINDGDKDVRVAGTSLLERLQTANSGIGDAVLLAIPTATGLVTPEGWGIQNTVDKLLKFARSPEHPGHITQVLTGMLKQNLWLTRATAIELLTSLNKYNNLKQHVQSVIPEIISLALTDREDGVRAAGIRSLAKLSQEDTLRDRIRTILPQLIPLIEVNNLKSPVLDLISLLAIDDVVREDVAAYIIPLITSNSSAPSEGLLDLLSRLILDKRFGHRQSSDHVMLAVASVLLMRPRPPSVRFQVATALWCNYSSKYLSAGDIDFEEHLVELFLFMLFRRHVTPGEVKRWLSMSTYLPEAPISGRDL